MVGSFTMNLSLGDLPHLLPVDVSRAPVEDSVPSSLFKARFMSSFAPRSM